MMKTTDYRARVGLVVLGIALLLLVMGLPMLFGGAVGVLATILGDTSQASGGWLVGVIGLLVLAAIVGIGALIAFGAWQRSEQGERTRHSE
jgi:hypothetical protein